MVRWRRIVASGPALALVSTALAVGALEAGFRLADFDFEWKAHAFNTVPIFYRQPIVPVGPAFFRRPGPDRWEGVALDVMYRMAGGDDGTYRDVPPVAITYDASGFRNPADLADWEVVVAGDSFTELGFLPYDQLFTTLVGRALDLRVKNLGVSYTGPLTQTEYLREFGKSPSTTEAILVFFEGNDFQDLANEDRRLRLARASGAAPLPPRDAPTRLEELPKQRSFVTALYRWVTGARPAVAVGTHPFIHDAGRFNAWFVAGGARTPVTIERQRAPSVAELSADDRDRLDAALAGFAAAARGLGLRPWLVFMPAKRRALDGCLEWTGPDAVLPLPAGIPDLVASIAAAHDLRVVDVTPALQAESRAGRLTYNTRWDTHLNAHGSAVVADVLTAALRAAQVSRASRR